MFLAPGTSFVEDTLSTDWGVGGFRMSQAHVIYCTLYFYYYYINCTSDHQALDPGMEVGSLLETPAIGKESKNLSVQGGREISLILYTLCFIEKFTM